MVPSGNYTTRFLCQNLSIILYIDNRAHKLKSHMTLFLDNLGKNALKEIPLFITNIKEMCKQVTSYLKEKELKNQ